MNMETEAEVEENCCLEVYDTDRKVLDFRRQKATNLRDNPRVYLPTPSPQKEELIMGAKEVYRQEAVETYRVIEATAQGTQVSAQEDGQRCYCGVSDR